TLSQSNNGASASITIVGGAGGGGGVALANSQSTFSSGTVNLLEGGGAITIDSSAGGQSFKVSVPQNSSLSVTGGLSISTNGSTISLGPAAISTYVNMMPGSTGSQTLGTMGATSASALFFPVSVESNVAFDAIRVGMLLSYVSSTRAASQTISQNFGLYSN